MSRRPWRPLARPLSGSRLALVVSSLCLSRGREREPGVTCGAPVLRAIAGDVDTRALLAEASDSPGAANLERNVAAALDRLREAEAEGRVGALATSHLALCGPMTATARAVKRAARQAAAELAGGGAQAAFLVPT